MWCWFFVNSYLIILVFNIGHNITQIITFTEYIDTFIGLPRYYRRSWSSHALGFNVPANHLVLKLIVLLSPLRDCHQWLQFTLWPTTLAQPVDLIPNWYHHSV